MAASDSIVSILKSTVSGRRPAVDVKKAGQPYVNFTDMQFGVIDTHGTPQDLIAITFWKAHATYAVGAMVIYSGGLYKCKTANSDATWKIAHWTTETDISITWAKVSGKPTTFPINAAATALIVAAKKAGTDAHALTVINKDAIVVAKTAGDKGIHDATAAMTKATAADTLSKTNKTGLAAVLAKVTTNATNIAKNVTDIIAVTKMAGPTGPRGAAGTNGAKGDKGDPGATGHVGPASTVAGPQGAPGATGHVGGTGAIGPSLTVGTVTATTGVPTIVKVGTALNFKLKTGATGARGATGHIGTPGAKGATGARGAAGAKAVVRAGHANPTGGAAGDLYIQY